MEHIRVFYLNFVQFLEVKFSIYLNRHVSVMNWVENLRCNSNPFQTDSQQL